ncbi:hypothetical protein BsWGS_28792 [Bradybaena similaris]
MRCLKEAISGTRSSRMRNSEFRKYHMERYVLDGWITFKSKESAPSGASPLPVKHRHRQASTIQISPGPAVSINPLGFTHFSHQPCYHSPGVPIPCCPEGSIKGSMRMSFYLPQLYPPPLSNFILLIPVLLLNTAFETLYPHQILRNMLKQHCSNSLRCKSHNQTSNLAPSSCY